MLVVADKKCVSCNEECISLFPVVGDSDSFRFNLDSLVVLSKQQSFIIDIITNEICDILVDHKIYENISYRIILRPVVVSIVNIFFDRALRVLNLVNKYDKENIYGLYSEVPEVKYLTDLSAGSVSSCKFNQGIINSMLSALGVKLANREIHEKDIKTGKFNNNCFHKKTTISQKIINKISVLLPSVTNKISTFGVGYESYSMKKAGLFGPFGLLDEGRFLDVTCDAADLILRESIRKKIHNVLCLASRDVFNNINIKSSSNNINAISSSFSYIFMRCFPTSCLESAITNVLKYDSFIASYKSKYIIGSDLTSSSGVFLSVAAKENNIKLVGYQHSGHYGYIDDMFSLAQFEYANSDIFISWGWSSIDEYFPKCEVVELPVPTYSENYFISNAIDMIENTTSCHRNDVLFMSNKIHRFSGVYTSGHQGIDFADEMLSMIRSVVVYAAKYNLTLMHKPGDEATYRCFNKFFMELESVGGKNYHLYDSFDKGLTEKLLSTTKIVIWDQIGTGTLECFNAKIPAVIFWPRIYSKENIFSKSRIQKLESVGVVHRDVESLFREIIKFNKDPSKWMGNAMRISAISEFCYKYARIDKDWVKQWRAFLIKLKDDAF
jgi:putative transferase (TIGR04331 family)